MPEHRRIAIVTDSTADLPPELAESLHVTVVPLGLRFGHDSFRERIDLSTDDLIERMALGGSLPATSSPSQGAFAQAFRDLAVNHDAIIAVLMSSRLSSTVKSARMAAKTVEDDIQVEIVDSLNVSFGLGLQVIRAVELCANNESVEVIADQLRSEVSSNHVVFFIETLELLRRNGLVGKATELLGAFLHLKPVLRIEEGQVIPHERARTRAKALDALVAFAKSLPAVDEIAVIYDTTPEDVEALQERLAGLVDPAKLISIQFGPSLAAHIGPGVVGLAIRERQNG